MGKFIVVFLSLVMLLGLVVSMTDRVSYNSVPYPRETAIKNGDLVRGSSNVDKLDIFMENVRNGEIIDYTFDNTRDSFGLPTIEKKKFTRNSLYKKGPSYYLRNVFGELLIF
ncbi:MAG TPA: hypothetical protein VIK72_10425 [Clostridiaceae bacterium]